MTQKRNIRIWWDLSVKAYRLQGAWDEKLVEFLKSQIPSSDRHWDPQSKIWTFTESYLTGTEKLCSLLFGSSNVSVLSRQQVESANTATNGASSAASVKSLNTFDIEVVEWVRLLPYEAAQSAYRKAALSLHPDRGGDMEKMSRLNQLWNRIEKEIYHV